MSLKDAEELVDTVDRERILFVKHYFGADWPTRSLYHVMINTAVGDENVIVHHPSQHAHRSSARSRACSQPASFALTPRPELREKMNSCSLGAASSALQKMQDFDPRRTTNDLYDSTQRSRKTLRPQTSFRSADLLITPRDRVGLVGANGTGKIYVAQDS